MRLYEIADAEEQLGLLRLVFDNTWAAIAQQAEQQKRAAAARKLSKPVVPRVPKPAVPRVPTPPKTPANTAQPGDLAYYPGHVMLYLGVDNAIIHSPQTGRSVSLDVVGSRHTRSVRFGNPLG
jgi:cell wall-associated NlpC family hydrolase